MPTIAIVYATEEGQSRVIAGFASQVAETEGWTAAVIPAAAFVAGPGVLDPAAVMLVASIHVGRHSAAATAFIRDNLPLLQRTPSALISVSLSAADPQRRHQAQEYVDELRRQTGWDPVAALSVAGALRYSEYGVVKRLIVRRIALGGGLPADMKHDHELTDWDEVRAFTTAFLGRAAAVPPPASP